VSRGGLSGCGVGNGRGLGRDEVVGGVGRGWGECVVRKRDERWSQAKEFGGEERE